MNLLDLCDLMYGFPWTKEDGNSQSDREPLTPGQIATEIEENGCYGFDDYGRFIKPGQKGSDQIKVNALKAVAATQAAYLETNFEDESVEYFIESFFEHDESVLRYGWPESNLPTFEKPSSVVLRVPKRRGQNVLTQTTMLEGLIKLAIDNSDSEWNATLNDLLEAAGFPNLNKHGEVERLHKALGSYGKRDTLSKSLRQLGLLKPQ